MPEPQSSFSTIFAIDIIEWELYSYFSFFDTTIWLSFIQLLCFQAISFSFLVTQWLYYCTLKYSHFTYFLELFLLIFFHLIYIYCFDYDDEIFIYDDTFHYFIYHFFISCEYYFDYIFSMVRAHTFYFLY